MFYMNVLLFFCYCVDFVLMFFLNFRMKIYIVCSNILSPLWCIFDGTPVVVDNAIAVDYTLLSCV